MSTATDARTVGARVDSLLTELQQAAEPAVHRTAEELVRCLVEFYGDGLARILALLSGVDGGPGLIARLAEDPLVRALLVLHDLHPASTAERVRAALDSVRPRVGTVQLLEIRDMVVSLRLPDAGHGCPSTTASVRRVLEAAVNDLAPEITGIEIDGVPAPPPELTAGPAGRTLLPLLAGAGIGDGGVSGSAGGR